VHIPDGYLGPTTVAVTWAACLPAWYWANRAARVTLTRARAVPMLAASAAFSFLVMMLNIPVLGGTTGHAVGAVLVAIVAGPEIAVLAVTAALVVQALLFADGGLLALGANCLTMAVAAPLVGYGVYRLLAGASSPLAPRRLAAAGAAAYAGILTAALLTGILLGVQPLLHSVDGVPQYAPYGLGVALPAMLLSHLLIAGPVEVVFTVGVYAFLARTSPDLLAAPAASLHGRWAWGLVAALIALTPLGLVATGTAWGEWGSDELRDQLGYVPEGFSRLGEWYTGLLPDYALPGGGEGGWAVVVYVASALLGVAALAALAWVAVALHRRSARRRGRA
jgi:cobalt/nickel transport system permease protein